MTLIDSLLTSNHRNALIENSGVYNEIKQRNRLNHDKVEGYMHKLEKRNQILKQYIDKIERSLSKSKKEEERIQKNLHANMTN